MPYRLLADLVVIVHALYAAFIVVGLAAILWGRLRGWQWVGNFWFRAVHFAMIAVVAAEAMLGVACPLTVLENRLREAAGETVGDSTFLARMAHQTLFWHAPEWVFAALQIAFGAAILATLFLAPPRWPRRRTPILPPSDGRLPNGPQPPKAAQSSKT
jgi:hypothetical protein